jgi:glycosyltransferase involved in cell wall biosynthesis
MMRVVAISSLLWKGGAQIANLEFFELLNLYPELKLKVIVCDNADNELILLLSSMKIPIIKVPCNVFSRYPFMNLKVAEKAIEEADIIWVTDIEYPVIPYIKTYAKEKRRKLPIVAYLHSYALICPHWNAIYGLTQVCLEKCTFYRVAKCEQDITVKLLDLGILNAGLPRLHQSYSFIRGFFNFFKWKRLVDNFIDYIDGFIAPSRECWNIYVSHVNDLKRKPNVIIYNPVIEPLKYVKPNPDEPYDNYIIYASGYNIFKGPHVLLEAWSKLAKKFKDVKLYMVGCKDSWVEVLAKKKGLNNVVFFSKIPSSNYYYLLFKAKATITPSIWPETFGRIPVEANRLGVPAVVSSIGGLPENIVDGITGYIFRAGDVNDLAEKITWILERNFDRGEIIRYSYEKINPHKEVEKLIRFFESMISYDRGV